jgi:hypothetical protein
MFSAVAAKFFKSCKKWFENSSSSVAKAFSVAGGFLTRDIVQRFHPCWCSVNINKGEIEFLLYNGAIVDHYEYQNRYDRNLLQSNRLNGDSPTNFATYPDQD